MFARASQKKVAQLPPPPLQLFTRLALGSLARSYRAGNPPTCPSPIPEYFPTPQFAHAAISADAVLGLALPASHVVHSETPSEEVLYLPASQSTQSLELVEPVMPMYVPAAQGAHIESSSTPLYLPTGQTSQLPPPETWPDPAGHV